MRSRDIQFIRDIEKLLQEAWKPFMGRTMSVELIEELAVVAAEAVGPAVAKWIGPIFENLKAVNLGGDKVEVTVGVFREGLERLRDLRRTGNLTELLEEIDKHRVKR